MPSSRPPRRVRRWVRRAAAAHEDAWRERLAPAGTGLVIHRRPGTGILRLEAYAPDQVLRALQAAFGGKIESVDIVAIAARANAPRRPLRIARDLVIIDAHGSWPASRRKPRILLRIAGAMAFGTGEHATTAACLRFLRREAARAGPDWTLLDIGTGSGILAIAAEKTGARRVDAFDCDARAIQAAQANLRRNRCRRVRLAARDLLRWKPRHRYPLVVANVLSEILRRGAPQITAAVRPGGCLVLSGLLRPQERATLATFRARGFRLEAVSRRGPWVTLQLRSPRTGQPADRAETAANRATAQRASRLPRRTARSASCKRGNRSRISRAAP